MKIAQIKQWQDKVYKYNNKADCYAQIIAKELQKYCDFVIKFCENTPSDGLVACYDDALYTDCHISVDKLIVLYERLKRKLTFDDIRTSY